jgi:hypothetical protein
VCRDNPTQERRDTMFTLGFICTLAAILLAIRTLYRWLDS